MLDIESIQGIVFDIQRFSVHDGPGIRTSVFLKGCPLYCHWCHNPESQRVYPEISFNESMCAHCGACVRACPRSCHRVDRDGDHIFDRTDCETCGICCESCLTKALEVAGRYMTAGQVRDEALKDSAYYRASRGGVTLSGGEPLSQADFAAAILSLCKSMDIHTAIETCGQASWEAIAKVLPYTDLFLYDIKESDPVRLRRFTGGDLSLIRDNLRRVDAGGVEIVLRCPIIPGVNDREDHFAAIGALADELQNVSRIDVEPYNPLGQSKSGRVGKQLLYVNDTIPDEELVSHWSESIRKHTRHAVKRY